MALCALSTISAQALLLPEARGELRLLGDFQYSLTKADTTDKNTGEVTNNDSHRFAQLYSLKLDRAIYPSLAVRGGGIFQQTNTSGKLDNQSIASSSRQIQPYLEFELSNPLYGAGAGYRMSRIRNSAARITTRNILEEYTARLHFRPVELPRLSLEYIHSLAHDEPQTTKTTSDFVTLASRYMYRDWTFEYSHTSLKANEEVHDNKTLTTTDNGSVLYATDFLNRRLAVDGAVRYSRNATSFSGSGSRKLQTTPVGSGFFLLQDPSPEQNLPNAFTVVDATHPYTTVNIGRGGGSAQLSIGLDFAQAIRFDELHLLLEKDEQNTTLASPGQIASVALEFTWRVFVSADQLSWNEQSLAGVSYNVFENSFEFTFPAVEARYVKIVTTPLYLAAPGEIRVSSLQAFVSLPTGKSAKVVATSTNFNGGAGWKVSDRTYVRYDLFLQQQTSEPFGSDQSMVSNGLSARHVLSRVFSTTGRYLLTNGWQSGGRGYMIHDYSASLTGRYLETFYQTLSYAGNQTDDQQGHSISNALLLRNYLNLYRGWSLLLDQGYSWQRQAESGKITNFFLRAATRITPNRKMDFNIDYTISWKTEEEQGNSQEQTGRFTAFLLPFDTLSLTADISYRARRRRTDREHFVLQDYSVNWSPFREGTLQFSLIYNQAQLARNHRTKSLSPTMKWQMTPHSLLILTYVVGKDSNGNEETDFQTGYSELRLYY